MDKRLIKINEFLKDVAEELGNTNDFQWNLEITDNGEGEDITIEIEFTSPLGEDFVFYIQTDPGDVKSLSAEVEDYIYNCYDTEKHAVEWYLCRGNVSGVPDSLEVLLDDAKSIQEYMFKISNKMKEVAVRDRYANES